MKKLLLLAAIAAGAYLVYRKMMASRAEEDLWTEATSSGELGGNGQEPAATPPAEAH